MGCGCVISVSCKNNKIKVSGSVRIVSSGAFDLPVPVEIESIKNKVRIDKNHGCAQQ